MLKLNIMKRIVLLLSLMLVFSCNQACAYWIWQPKTGQWINPKATLKASPKEQLEFAKSLYEAKSYDEAKRECQQLLKVFPKAAEAAEAQYYLALIAEAKGNLYEAFLGFQKVIDKYPFSERITEIVEKEYKIGESFMAGEKRKAFGVNLPVENPAIEIFTKVVENSTYGPLAAKAQYKLGLVLKGLARYYEAEEAFNKVITNYPGSEWVGPAQFQLATCRAAVSTGPEYDQMAAKEAKEKFEEFVKDHPDAVLSADAEKNIGQLEEKEAEGSFTIGRFYEKQKQLDAAKIYYNDIVVNHPKSPFAAQAFERLRVLEKRTK
jgi:outer membrane assembly lipoprotein YfiO